MTEKGREREREKERERKREREKVSERKERGGLRGERERRIERGGRGHVGRVLCIVLKYNRRVNKYLQFDTAVKSQSETVSSNTEL